MLKYTKREVELGNLISCNYDPNKNYHQNIHDLLNIAEIDEVIPHLLRHTNKIYDKKYLKIAEEISSKVETLMQQLDLVSKRLAEENIKIVALKNAGITRGLYQDYACSPMGDIDLLVSSKDFLKAHEILVNDLKYIFKFRSDYEQEDLEIAFKSGGTEYYKDVNGYRVWLELQWRPVAGRWIQPHNEPCGDELISKSVSIPDSNVRILSPEDNLLQVCLHTAKHSYCRAPGFRLHTDVDRIVNFSKIDWQRFINKVKKLKLQTAVYYSLLIPKDLLNTTVPDSVIHSFKPNWFRRTIIESLLNKAGLTNQLTRKFSKPGYIVFNLALYDSLGETIKAIFPPSQTMKRRYSFSSSFLLPYYHLKRILNLAFRRAKL